MRMTPAERYEELRIDLMLRRAINGGSLPQAEEARP